MSGRGEGIKGGRGQVFGDWQSGDAEFIHCRQEVSAYHFLSLLLGQVSQSKEKGLCSLSAVT